MGQSSSSLSVSSYQSSYQVPTGKRVIFDLLDDELQLLVAKTDLTTDAVLRCAKELQAQEKLLANETDNGIDDDETDNDSDDGSNSSANLIWKDSEFYEDSGDEDRTNAASKEGSDDRYRIQAQLALRLVQISRDVAKVRFRIVPTKIREPMFWRSVFVLLDRQLNQSSSRNPSRHVLPLSIGEDGQQQALDASGAHDESMNGAISPEWNDAEPMPEMSTILISSETEEGEQCADGNPRAIGNHPQASSLSISSSSSSPSEVSTSVAGSASTPTSTPPLSELESSKNNHSVANQRVMELEREVERLRKIIQRQKRKMKRQSKQVQAQSGKDIIAAAAATAAAIDKNETSQNEQQHVPSLPQQTAHKGQWIMDNDSKEFLEFPEELKQNMRDEKQKRLNQVRLEMRFILDTDRIEDSNGRWECCGSTQYGGECSTK